MSDAIRNRFGSNIQHGNVAACIAILEDGLRWLRETSYHAILGRSFLHHVNDAAEYIVDLHKSAGEEFAVAAMYFEMNGFTINPDRWHFDGFAYRTGGDLWDLTWSTEWLPNWNHSTSDSFELTGFEPVQQAFDETMRSDGQPLGVQLASEIAEYLVVARFDELIAAAAKIARQLRPQIEGVPILSTAHDWDMLFPAQ